MNSRLTLILFLVAGSILLFTPSVATEVQGHRYFFSVSEADSPDGEIRTYEELPPEAQTAFDEARAEGTINLYENPDREAIATFFEVDYVRVDGTYYRISIRSEVNDSTLGESLTQFVLTPLLLLGGFLVAYGLLTLRNPDWQPTTLGRAGTLIGLTWLLSIIGTVVSIYATTGLVLVEEIRMFVSYTAVFIVTLVPVLTGGAIRRRKWLLAGLSVLPIASFLVFGLFGIGIFLVLFGYSVIFGGMFAVFGYLVTEPIADS